MSTGNVEMHRIVIDNEHTVGMRTAKMKAVEPARYINYDESLSASAQLLDIFKHTVDGMFDHEFVQYADKGQCVICGWTESVHGPTPTHIYCDGCMKLVAVTDTFGMPSVERGNEIILGNGLRIPHHLSHFLWERYFCSQECVDDWFEGREY